MPNVTIAKRILIVEDDVGLARVIADNLRFEGYQVDSASRGDEAIGRARSFSPDLVLLDVMLPNRSGFDLCSTLRNGGRVAVIMLTALSQKGDKLRGLNLGADDYITKPFDLPELLARIRAVLRRSHRPIDRIVLGPITVDFTALRATGGKGEVHLTHREFEILRYLAERKDRFVRRDELLREVWGYPDGIDTTRSVDHAIVRLRKKIEPDPHNPQFIRTVHGDGYCLTRSDE
jgi:DNA-binding response OmpR family regulator